MPSRGVREVKHGRLAMLAFTGFLAQAYITETGPMANLAAHRADPYNQTWGTYAALRNAAVAAADTAADAAAVVGDAVTGDVAEVAGDAVAAVADVATAL